MYSSRILQILSVGLSLGLVLLMANLASGDIPRRINYQGRVTDGMTGEPLPGDHEMVFRIYDADVYGSLLWSEEQTVAADPAGVLSAILGSDTAIEISFTGPCWLEVEVDGEVLVPRREMVSVPFAFRALNSDSLGGFTSTSFSLVGHTHDEAYVNEEQASSVTAAMVVPDIVSSIDGVTNDAGNVDLVAGSYITITPDDGNNRITIAAMGVGDGHSLDAADGSPTNAVYVDNAGEVGIGTTLPASKLDVRGAMTVGTDAAGHDVNFYGHNSDSRLFWDESKMAFRAGSDDGMGYWDDANTGEYSMALGFGVKASGEQSIALGRNASAEGFASLSLGSYASAGVSRAIAIGNYVEASGYHTMVLGSGAGPEDLLVNDTPASLMIGVDSSEPAMLVDSSGRVCIGATEPVFQLNVRHGIMVGPPVHSWPLPVGVGISAAASSDSPLIIQNPDGPILRVTGDGDIGVGHRWPLALLHAQDTDLDLDSDALHADVAVVEADNAILGLYSSEGGSAGSALTFGEITGAALVDKWAIVRETTDGGTGGGSGLRFTFGTLKDQFQNSTIMYLDDTGKVGIGTWTFGSETLRVNGSACAAAWNICSDLRFKEKIEDVENALDMVLRLRGVRFNWRREEHEDRNFPEGPHYGVIAQEAELVIPEIVSAGPDGERSVAYSEVIPILIESIKELRAENLALLERIEALEAGGN